LHPRAWDVKLNFILKKVEIWQVLFNLMNKMSLVVACLLILPVVQPTSAAAEAPAQFEFFDAVRDIIEVLMGICEGIPVVGPIFAQFLDALWTLLPS
jgi:hypothetical protein